MSTDHLITPHGGELVDLLVDDDRAEELKRSAQEWLDWDLTDRQLCDLELLTNGGFSPLRGFLTQQDYTSVCEDMRLSDGTLWPVPITLDVTEEFAEGVSEGDTIALRDPEGTMLAAIHVEDVWRPDKQREAELVFGTANPEHPAVDYLLNIAGPVYIGGRLEAVQLPNQYDFKDLRLTPKQVRERFADRGWTKVVAFQTRNPMHRAHVEITKRAATENSANLLIHPVVGMTKPGDVDHFTRVRVYQYIMDHYPTSTADLALLPLAMRMGGPREAVWHAIIRKNHGVTHFIVGRDHAGPGSDSSGEPFYGPYEAQELLSKHQDELGVTMVPFRMMVYVPSRDAYEPIDELDEGTKTASISGTELRERLATGREIPEWFTYPEVVEELRRTYPPRSKRGFTVFFTGLSGSGKSTVANVLQTKLLEAGGRSVTLLDGDIVRKNLSSELGFSKEHRDINVLRIGYVSSEITKHGGIAIAAPIAPYDEVRKMNRAQIEETGGGYILVHISTPLEVCEERDRKGLYAKARAGIIKGFTGIDDPYEEPDDAELVIDTTDITPEEAANRILVHLEREGWYDVD
ncbi:MAG: bifunctional sulfate adenylyltransferase/adenylylsulfate kinase [Nitriliruptorales bacterium]|nr:bifunctional sulfate adenylyltransferase/adenylylsulfate kinase [Nitriliruptorales bacterium]